MIKKSLLLAGCAILFGTLVLAACSSAASADPQTVVQDYYAALNAGDVDAAMAFVASDAVFANPTGVYDTPGEIRAGLEAGVESQTTFELSNFRVDGGRVVYDYKVLVGGSVVDSGTDGLTIVENGKIVFDGTESSEPAN